MVDMNFTAHWAGILAVAIFVLAYVLVIAEEATHLRKSQPVIIAAGLIWALIGVIFSQVGHAEALREHAMEIIADYGELFLFLFVAITYVNTLEERRAFDQLRAALVARGLGYRSLFWLTGILAFVLSGLLDNLTTSLVIGAVVIALGRDQPRFVTLGAISTVVAANAGGAFSPFGDITTLMVWQQGKIEFFEFFVLFIPSVINWLVPAVILSLALPAGAPEPSAERVRPKPGMWGVAALFAATIVTAVLFRNLLSLPPALGMMLGLGYLQLWAWILSQRGGRRQDAEMVLDSYHQMARVEWDTLLFFFGIIFSVGGLGVLGYLALASDVLFQGLGPTSANVLIGALSAIVDNIPLMFAVLKMDPAMSDGQWLLITLTCGVGGSLLSIGSAAGVALMGQARGQYTFASHLKWTWAIALGYVAAIGAHMVVNAHLF